MAMVAPHHHRSPGRGGIPNIVLTGPASPAPSAATPSTSAAPRPGQHGSRIHSLSTIAEAPHDGDRDIFDLPPIPNMKNAISRRNVSSGVHYLLPVDKSRSGVEGEHRTNLRAMFTQPYITRGHTFNEDWLTANARRHLQPNTSNSLTPAARTSKSSQQPYRLNQESEAVRVNYSYSAPSTGLSGRRINGQERDMRPRSDLFLPLKAQVPPEAIRLKQEAERILASVQDPRAGDVVQPDAAAPVTSASTDRAAPTRRKTSLHVSMFPEISLSADTWADEEEEEEVERKASRFGSYAALKAFTPPEKRPLPASLRAQQPAALSEQRAAEIWDWLHDYENIDHFQYFMHVCD